MIKATAIGEDGQPMLVLGITDENCRRLMDGDPILVKASVLNREGGPTGVISHDVLIFHGATYRDLVATMKEGFGSLPKPHRGGGTHGDEG